MKALFTLIAAAMLFTGCRTHSTQTANAQPAAQTTVSEGVKSTVYLTREISPESLVKIYNALGRKAEGRVAVKISTGEAGNNNYLKPELIKNLVEEVNGTIVECNTAYGGQRTTFENHWQTLRNTDLARCLRLTLWTRRANLKFPLSTTQI